MLKLVVVLQLRDHPLLQPDVGLDTAAYVELARRVVAGDLALGPGLYYVSPLYIYFLASAWPSLTPSRRFASLQILLGTASVALHIPHGARLVRRARSNDCGGYRGFTGLFTFYEVADSAGVD